MLFAGDLYVDQGLAKEVRTLDTLVMGAAILGIIAVIVSKDSKASDTILGMFKMVTNLVNGAIHPKASS